MAIPVDNQFKWYCVHTYSGHEKKVQTLMYERLEAMKAKEKVTEVFIPTREKVVIDNGKKRTVEERIFPGYVLVRMQLSDETYHIVRGTLGVTGFVGPMGKPTALSDQEAEGIIRYSELTAPKLEVSVKAGDNVRIIDGPFSDMDGKVDSVDDDKGKLTVLVNIFGRETPVELDFLQVTEI